MFARPIDSNDPEQYAALDDGEIRADPLLRLALRDASIETGAGVILEGGIRVRMNDKERTVLQEMTEHGAPASRVETCRTMDAALDLHARHHFTRCCATDGSLMEREMRGGGLSRRVSWGVWEGPRGAGWRSAAVKEGMWGGRLPSDYEIADAETVAIERYLRKVVERAGRNSKEERVLIMSDSLGCLDAIEQAWREGDARALRGRDRGALIESVCSLRARLGLVVFMFTPSHKGGVPNAIADCVAGAMLAAKMEDIAMDLQQGVKRACVHMHRSDFSDEGVLRPQGSNQRGRFVMWDRRLFPALRRRVARWVHKELAGERGDDLVVDPAFVGRRWHTGETKSWAEVTRLGLACAKLDREEEEPVERMEADRQRVYLHSLARVGRSAGVKGAHDVNWRRKYDEEQRRGRPGPETRHGARGCPGCMLGVVERNRGLRGDREAVCTDCNGWVGRGWRGGKVVCGECGCGGGPQARARTATQRREAHGQYNTSAMGEEGWQAGSRRVRRLQRLTGEKRERGLCGYTGLQQTTDERLLRMSVKRDEDTVASDRPLAEDLADLRHIFGGECEAQQEPKDRAVVEGMCTQLQTARRDVESAGAGRTRQRSTRSGVTSYSPKPWLCSRI